MKKNDLYLHEKIADYKIQIDNLNQVITRIDKLSNFYSRIEAADSVAEIFRLFAEELEVLLKIDFSGLFLLSDDELEFEMKVVVPEKFNQDCAIAYYEAVKSDVFGWAINQKRFSVVPYPGSVVSAGKKGVLLIVFPMKRNRKIFGAIVSQLQIGQNSLSSEQQTFLSIISKQATLALGNALYLVKINTQKMVLEKYKKRIDEELNAAKRIQESIIPTSFDDIDGVKFSSRYLPYHKIGGDYFDVVKIDKYRFVAVMADVSGHGVPAALGTAILKSAVYSTINPLNFDFQKSVVDLYRHLWHSLPEEQFATMFIGDFNVATHKVEYYSFGHLPVIHRKDKGGVGYLKATSGFIGISELKDFLPSTAFFDKKDIFMLLTDGVVECADENEDIFGLERIVEVVANSDKNSLITTVLDRMNSFAGEENIDDDITMLQIDIL